MFVVVYINCAKKYVVVPDNWIYDVKMESLLNYGVNSNRNVLIFWSSDFQNTPNFCLDKSLEFPPRNNQTCYLARLIRYFGKLFFSSWTSSFD